MRDAAKRRSTMPSSCWQSPTRNSTQVAPAISPGEVRLRTEDLRVPGPNSAAIGRYRWNCIGRLRPEPDSQQRPPSKFICEKLAQGLVFDVQGCPRRSDIRRVGVPVSRIRFRLIVEVLLKLIVAAACSAPGASA